MAERAATTRAATARRVLTWAFAAELAVLALTGIWLWRWYQPSPARSWAEIYRGDQPTSWSMRISDLHRWVAYVAVFPTSLALAALIAAQEVEGASRRAARVLRTLGAVAIPALTLAAAVLGMLLPWDQLALWAVTVGTDTSGYQPLFGDQVRFVIVGGAEVATATVRNVLLLHAVVAPALLVAALAATAPRHQRRRPPDPSGTDGAIGADRPLAPAPAPAPTGPRRAR